MAIFGYVAIRNITSNNVLAYAIGDLVADAEVIGVGDSGAWLTVGVDVALVGTPQQPSITPVIECGTWSITTPYAGSSMVQRNGQSYISLQANTGVDPATDGGTNWIKMAATGGQPPVVVPLIDGASISMNAAAGTHFWVTINGNRTLLNPTGATDGQKLTLDIKQGATGGPFHLSFDTQYAFSDGLPQSGLTWSTTAGKTDTLGLMYVANGTKWRVLSFLNGF